jgi:hypothetical protein
MSICVHDGMTTMVQGMGTNHPLCSVGLSTVTTEVTFQISVEITAAGKCFAEGNFLRKFVLIVCPEKRGICENVSLSCMTLQRRIGDISTNLSSQSKQRVNSASTP